MRINCIINSLTTGGAEKRLRMILEYLVRKHEVTLYLLEKDVRQPIDPRITLRQLSETTLRSGTAKKVWTATRSYRTLLREYRQQPPDLSISCLEPANTLNLMVSRKTGTRAIVFVSAYLSDTYINGVYGMAFRRLIRRNYKEASLVIANSKLAAADLVEKFDVPKEKVRVAYNPLDIARVRRMAGEPLTAAQQRIFARHKVIVTVGRLTEQKGQWYLIRTLKEVQRTVPDARLLIIGEGPLRPKLTQLVKHLHLENDVFLVGNQENPYKFVSRAAVFAFPTVWEGFPNVLLEALACGTPVISSDCRSGPRELLAPGTDIFTQTAGVEYAAHGILIPPVTRRFLTDAPLLLAEKCLVTALSRLLLEDKLRKRYASRGRARSKDFAEAARIRDVTQLLERFIK